MATRPKAIRSPRGHGDHGGPWSQGDQEAEGPKLALLAPPSLTALRFSLRQWSGVPGGGSTGHQYWTMAR
jgi:hypothetical protein